MNGIDIMFQCPHSFYSITSCSLALDLDLDRDLDLDLDLSVPNVEMLRLDPLKYPLLVDNLQLISNVHCIYQPIHTLKTSARDWLPRLDDGSLIFWTLRA